MKRATALHRELPASFRIPYRAHVSRHVVRTDPFAGIAQSLVQGNLPAAIAMQFEISDDAAITFASEFYRSIADGLPIDSALAEARLAIFAQDNGLEWGTPVLYLRSPNGEIFDVGDKSVSEPKVPGETSARAASPVEPESTSSASDIVQTSAGSSVEAPEKEGLSLDIEIPPMSKKFLLFVLGAILLFFALITVIASQKGEESEEEVPATTINTTMTTDTTTTTSTGSMTMSTDAVTTGTDTPPSTPMGTNLTSTDSPIGADATTQPLIQPIGGS